MTEAELNEGVTQILDSDKTAIPTQEGALKLRDVLTAVYKTQAPYNRWWHKLFGRPKASAESIILHLPDKVGQYINMSEGGRYLGFYNQVKEALELLARMELLDVVRVLELDEVEDEYKEQPLYGVSSYGRAFVDYGEIQSS